MGFTHSHGRHTSYAAVPSSGVANDAHWSNSRNRFVASQLTTALPRKSHYLTGITRI